MNYVVLQRFKTEGRTYEIGELLAEDFFRSEVTRWAFLRSKLVELRKEKEDGRKTRRRSNRRQS